MEQKLNSFKKIDTLAYERWFHRVVSHWHLFLLSILIALLGSYFFLRYTNTIYTVSASLLVKDASQNINPFESGRGGEYGGFSRNIVLTNDIKIFTSKRLIEESIKNIDWMVSYFYEGNLKNTEVYRFNEFRFVFSDTNNIVPYGKPINLKIKSQNTFKLSFREKADKNINLEGIYSFNKPYTVSGFIFSVEKRPDIVLEKDRTFIIKLNSKQQTINEFSGKLRASQVDKTSSILTISSNGSCIEKEKEFINMHCISFVKISLNDKNISHERTINFIEGQLNLISDTLSGLETQMIKYRKKYNSSNVEALAEKRFDKLEKLEEEKAKYDLNARYFSYLKDYLIKRKDYSDVVAPSNVGVDDPVLTELINQLISLKLKQNSSFRTENSQSPFKIDNENKINQIKKNIYEVVSNIESSNNILSEDLLRRINIMTRLTSSLLDNERNYIEFKRKYKINEELYNMLLKKKSEMAITRAGNVSDTKVVDFASVTGSPYPNGNKIYLTNLLIAFLIPIGYILLKYLTNYRIMEKDDVIAVCEMPFLGTIGHIPDDEKMVIINKPKSGLTESFRSIRANLSFFMPKPEQKVLLITSSLSGEGKTFTALNIASVLAVSGKKVVLIGADMRKPKVYLDMNVRNVEGLSNFLANKTDIDKIILDTSVENLLFINAGFIPPNPAELLTSPKVSDLMKYLKEQFDFVVIDTPPIGLVTDAFSLMKYSDLNIYVVRHNYTQTKYLKDLNEMIQAGLIKNTVYVLNDFNVSRNYGYGYRYGYDKGGYGYGSKSRGRGYYEEDEQPSYLSRVMRRMKRKRNDKSYYVS